MILIGIDSGVKTGFCAYDTSAKQIIELCTIKIHKALTKVQEYAKSDLVFVRVEDARKRKFFGNSSVEKYQGAGSIKRDAKIWEDFLIDENIAHEMVAPKHNTTKVSSEYFKKLTWYEGKTSEHARDAAMLVFNLSDKLFIDRAVLAKNKK